MLAPWAGGSGGKSQAGAIPRSESRWECETQGLQPLRIRCAGPVVLATPLGGQQRQVRTVSVSTTIQCMTVTKVCIVLSTARKQGRYCIDALRQAPDSLLVNLQS